MTNSLRRQNRLEDWFEDKSGYRLKMETGKYPDQQCPYCLFQGNQTLFLIQKKGKVNEFSEKQFQCPDCKVIMRRNTLFGTIDWTISMYAKWIFEIRKFDVNKRIKWDKIKQRLRDANLSWAFWDAYYKLKTETEDNRIEQQWKDYERTQGNSSNTKTT